MREYQDNAVSAMQKGTENNAETILKTVQDDASIQRNELNNAGSEGMMYLDIIPRFAL